MAKPPLAPRALLIFDDGLYVGEGERPPR